MVNPMGWSKIWGCISYHDAIIMGWFTIPNGMIRPMPSFSENFRVIKYHKNKRPGPTARLHRSVPDTCPQIFVGFSALILGIINSVYRMSAIFCAKQIPWILKQGTHLGEKCEKSDTWSTMFGCSFSVWQPWLGSLLTGGVSCTVLLQQIQGGNTSCTLGSGMLVIVHVVLTEGRVWNLPGLLDAPAFNINTETQLISLVNDCSNWDTFDSNWHAQIRGHLVAYIQKNIPNISHLYLNISQLYALRPLNAWFNHIFIPLHYIPMIVRPPTWTNWLPHHFPWLDPHSLNHIFLRHHLLMLRRLGNSHETAPFLLVKSWFLAGHIWVCLKMSCTPLYPVVLLIIIPFLKWL